MACRCGLFIRSQLPLHCLDFRRCENDTPFAILKEMKFICVSALDRFHKAKNELFDFSFFLFLPFHHMVSLHIANWKSCIYFSVRSASLIITPSDATFGPENADGWAKVCFVFSLFYSIIPADEHRTIFVTCKFFGRCFYVQRCHRHSVGKYFR